MRSTSSCCAAGGFWLPVWPRVSDDKEEKNRAQDKKRLTLILARGYIGYLLSESKLDTGWIAKSNIFRLRFGEKTAQRTWPKRFLAASGGKNNLECYGSGLWLAQDGKEAWKISHIPGWRIKFRVSVLSSKFEDAARQVLILTLPLVGLNLQTIEL